MVQWHYNFIVVIRLENLLNGTGSVCSTKTENWMKVKVKRSRRYGNKHVLNIG